MSEISPKQASYLALAAYSIKQNLEDLEVPLALRNDFSFKDMITGTSGGFFFRPETGFALLGKGKSERKKENLWLFMLVLSTKTQ